LAREDITRLLHELRDGDPRAQEALLPAVYAELRAIAHNRLSPGARDAVLDTTALVHEAYVRLFDRSPLPWADRRHFFAVAAMAMRQIVVDLSRRRSTARRGGGQVHVNLESTQVAVDEQAEEIVSLHEALLRLSHLDARLARIVELRFFGGFSEEETAEIMEMSVRTVRRDWRKARALLYQDITSEGTP
jgi:RNA polymerase sigma factor (TIGR02999 family)